MGEWIFSKYDELEINYLMHKQYVSKNEIIRQLRTKYNQKSLYPRNILFLPR